MSGSISPVLKPILIVLIHYYDALQRKNPSNDYGEGLKDGGLDILDAVAWKLVGEEAWALAKKEKNEARLGP